MYSALGPLKRHDSEYSALVEDYTTYIDIILTNTLAINWKLGGMAWT